jgi:hypothetical protein
MVSVIRVEPVDDHTLRLWFDDGVEREVDLSDVMSGPMGEPLKNPEFFRRVRVDAELRTVVWPNGFDLDPLVLHGDLEPVSPTTRIPGRIDS